MIYVGDTSFFLLQYWTINLGRKCLFIVRHTLLGPMEPNLNWFWNFANSKMILKNFLHRNVVVRNWKDNCKVFGTNINRVHFYELQSSFMNCNQLSFSSLSPKIFLIWVVHVTTKVSLAKKVNQFTQKFHFFWLNSFVEPHPRRRWESWEGMSEWVHRKVTFNLHQSLKS